MTILLLAFSMDANSFISKMVTELLSLNNERLMLQSQTSQSNPLFIELDEKINISKQNLILALRKLLKNLEIEKKKIKNYIAKTATKISYLPENRTRYLDIEREHKLNDAIYTFLLQKQSETQITKASNTPDNEIVDNAAITGVVSPSKNKNNKQAMLLAFIIPIGIIVLKEIFK